MKSEVTLVDGDWSNVDKLYWRALKTLSPDLVSNFITEHTLQQNSSYMNIILHVMCYMYMSLLEHD